MHWFLKEVICDGMTDVTFLNQVEIAPEHRELV